MPLTGEHGFALRRNGAAAREHAGSCRAQARQWVLNLTYVGGSLISHPHTGGGKQQLALLLIASDTQLKRPLGMVKRPSLWVVVLVFDSLRD